jgi:hypothetical protein
VLFIQGGGNGGYEADAELVASLRKGLGTAYKVHYPQILPMKQYRFLAAMAKANSKDISSARVKLFLAGHSLGASCC